MAKKKGGIEKFKEEIKSGKMDEMVLYSELKVIREILKLLNDCDVDAKNRILDYCKSYCGKKKGE